MHVHASGADITSTGCCQCADWKQLSLQKLHATAAESAVEVHSGAGGGQCGALVRGLRGLCDVATTLSSCISLRISLLLFFHHFTICTSKKKKTERNKAVCGRYRTRQLLSYLAVQLFRFHSAVSGIFLCLCGVGQKQTEPLCADCLDYSSGSDWSGNCYKQINKGSSSRRQRDQKEAVEGRKCKVVQFCRVNESDT